jgi:protein-S-isoprenylcysteine O-methyltransferase Ste14
MRLTKTNLEPIHLVRAINRVGYNHLLPAAIWTLLARTHLLKFQNSLTEGDWLLSSRYMGVFLFTSLVMLLFLLRHPSRGERAKPLEALVAISGTFGATFLADRPLHTPFSFTTIAGNALILLGLVWSMISLATLGRCFGILPEARGLVTRGPYRIVRHPIYLGEITILLGITIPVISLPNALITSGVIGLQFWRSVNEERVLESTFPEYAAYKSRTFRIVPFIW